VSRSGLCSQVGRVQVCRTVLIPCYSRESQTWGSGRAVVSDRDRGDIKKARKEGRLAEAMLDRRAAMKRYVMPAHHSGFATTLTCAEAIDMRSDACDCDRNMNKPRRDIHSKHGLPLWQVLVGVTLPALFVITDDAPLVRLAAHHILVDNQTLQPDRPPRVRLARADPDLCAQSVPRPIREPRRGIDKTVGAVQPAAPSRHGRF
jgi:hypothetical protein